MMDDTSNDFQKNSLKNDYNNATWLNIMGNSYFEEGNLDKAINTYRRGLRVMKEQPSSSFDPDILLVTLSNMSEAYRRRGDFQLALTSYQELLQLQLEKFGHAHPDVVKSLHIIGLIYDEMGDLTNALECINCVLRLQLQQYRNNSSNKNDDDNCQHMSTALTHAGCILFRTNKVSAATEHFTDALFIQRKISKEDNTEVAFTLYHLGLCYQAQDSYKEAIECYSNALEMEQKLLGPNHVDLMATSIKLGEVYVSVGMFNKALPCYERALRIERKINSRGSNGNDPGVSSSEIRILLEMGYIYYMQGNTILLQNIVQELSILGKELPMGQKYKSNSANIMFQEYLQLLDSSSRSTAPAA